MDTTKLLWKRDHILPIFGEDHNFVLAQKACEKACYPEGFEASTCGQKPMITQRTSEAQGLFEENVVSKQLQVPISQCPAITHSSHLSWLSEIQFCPVAMYTILGKNHNLVKPLLVISQLFGSDCWRAKCENQFQPKENLVEISESVFPFQMREEHIGDVPCLPFSAFAHCLPE